MFSFAKVTKNSKYASWRDSDDLVSMAFHFSTAQGDMVATSKLTRYKE
jgi:hypothetical protein